MNPLAAKRILIAFVCALGCAQPVQADARFSLFPNAAKVRVYGGPTSIDIAVRAGRVLEQNLSKNGRSRETPAIDGGWLTPDEVDQLRRAVSLETPGDTITVAACCFPRHAFLFYDAKGRYLGFLTVCFECGCAEIRPFKQDDSHEIHWDRSAVAAIVLAHHLGPLVPPRPS